MNVLFIMKRVSVTCTNERPNLQLNLVYKVNVFRMSHQFSYHNKQIIMKYWKSNIALIKLQKFCC